MTKEDLHKRLSQHPYSDDALARVLDEFFDSNVVIPKGRTSVYYGEDRTGCIEPIDAVAYMLNGGECIYLDGGTVIWDGERFKYKYQGNGFSQNSSFKYLTIKPSKPFMVL